jgi:hypothetical protein
MDMVLLLIFMHEAVLVGTPFHDLGAADVTGVSWHSVGALTVPWLLFVWTGLTGKLRNSCSPLRSAEVCGSLVVIAGADTHKAGHQMEAGTTVMQPVASFGVVSGRDVDLILAMPARRASTTASIRPMPGPDGRQLLAPRVL